MSDPALSHTSSKKMGLGMATIVGMNAMIGASIFTISEQLQKIAGPAGILTYLFVIVSIWCLAFSLARIAEYYPEEGSFYTYVHSWAGKAGGLIAALLYSLGLVIAMGLLTRFTGSYLHTFFPAVSPAMLGTGALALLTLSIVAGARLAHAGQIILIALTLVPLFIITLLCLSRAQVQNLVPFMPYGWSSIFKAAQIVIFGFFGFESVTSLHNMVAKPHLTVPRAITWAILLVSGIYLGFVTATFLGIPRELFLKGTTLPDALYMLFPQFPWLISLVVMGIIITIMGTIHAVIWSVSELIHSLTHRASLPIKLTSRQATGVISLLVWLSSVLFHDPTLFFNLTALCIIIPLAASIIPLAIKRVPVSLREQIIALIGLATAALMCGYALKEIVAYIL
jgi:amino acid transporter